MPNNKVDFIKELLTENISGIKEISVSNGHETYIISYSINSDKGAIGIDKSFVDANSSDDIKHFFNQPGIYETIQEAEKDKHQQSFDGIITFCVTGKIK